MAKFRMRPSIEFEAFRWTVDIVPEWWTDFPGVWIQTATGTAFLPSGDHANPGDYIVRDSTSRVFAIGRERFEAEYIPADEPIFEVLGRDQLAQGVVLRWIQRAAAADVSASKLERARKRYQEIIEFQSDHPERVKVPD